MVKGLETFRDFFADYRDCYVIIGGSACDLYFAEQDLPFRVTHDIDMILCVESLTPAFFNRFWEFIRAGGYVNRQRSDGRPQFYRFSKPAVAGFPAMLELFSRKADFLPDDGEGHLTPVPAGEDRWAVTPNIPEGSTEMIKINLAGKYGGYWANIHYFKQ